MNFKNIGLSGSEEINVSGEGSYIYVVNALSLVQVRAQGVNVKLKAGQGVEVPNTFKSINIKNLSTSLNEIDIVIGHGQFLNGEFSGAVVSTTVQGKAIASSAVSVGVAEVQLVPADDIRKQVIIQNNHASNMLYIGGAGVTALTGLKLEPTSTLVIDNACAAEWRAIADAAGTDVRIIEAV